jgi:uncharacterized protein YodC (DUF2158 family)
MFTGEERMAENFKVGDVVKLKSSVVKMTVGGYDKVGSVICRWFAGTESKTDIFPEDSLEPVGKDPTGTNRPSRQTDSPWT